MKTVAGGLAVFFAAYLVVYLVLTLGGRYEPVVIRPHGVSAWGWAPLGFHNGTRWRNAVLGMFAPLYVLDKRYWHEDQRTLVRPTP